METLQIISLSLGIVLTVFNLAILLSKKFRGIIRKIILKKEEVGLRDEEQRETDRCLLRNAILMNYKAYKDLKSWTVDDYENFKHMYTQYKKLKGNSFVDKLWKAVQSWEIEM